MDFPFLNSTFTLQFFFALSFITKSAFVSDLNNCPNKHQVIASAIVDFPEPFEPNSDN